MPQRIAMSIKSVGILISSAIGICGAMQAYTILPYRVDQIEKKAQILQAKVDQDHDLLIQISRDITFVRERMSEKNSSNR